MDNIDKFLSTVISTRIVTFEDYLRDKMLFIDLKDGDTIIIENDRGATTTDKMSTSESFSYYGRGLGGERKVNKRIRNLILAEYPDLVSATIAEL